MGTTPELEIPLNHAIRISLHFLIKQKPGLETRTFINLKESLKPVLFTKNANCKFRVFKVFEDIFFQQVMKMGFDS